MLYDLKTRKSHWISKDSNTSVGFCNADGSVVFWYSKDGLMAYDIKKGRSWRTGIDLTKFKASIRPSSIKNTILVVGVDRNRLAHALSKSLQGWRIVEKPFDISRMCHDGEISWSREGDYFYFREKTNEGKCRLAIYDANGNLQRYIDNLPVRPWVVELIISGNYYYLDRLNHLIKKIDVRTGEITAYTVPDKTQAFDINSKGELIYSISRDQVTNIWVTPKLGDTSYLLEYEGSAPRFSSLGNYVYFHVGSKGIIILKRR